MTEGSDLAVRQSVCGAAPKDAGRRVMIFFDSDRTIANFLMTGAFRDLCERHQVTFVTPPHSKRFSLDPSELFAPDCMVALPTVDERVAGWSRMAMIDQLAWQPGEHWKKMRRMRRMAMGRRERLIMSIAALPGISSIVKAAIRRKLAAAPYTRLDDLLVAQKPDVVIYPTAFNGPFANDLAVSAKRRGIRTIFLMNSWDNPSTKNLLSEMPDWIGVWGEQTASHAVRFMGIPQDRVVILGAPQLEALTANPPIESRAAKIALGLDPNRPVVLFGESTMYENTVDRLAELDDWCGRQSDPKPQVLFRPYPFLEGRQADAPAIQSLPNVVVQTVSPYQRAQTPEALEAVQKERLIALNASDAVISKLSTILIEAMLLEKPLICIVPTGRNSIFSKRNAPLAHFHEILTHRDVIVINDQQDMASALDQLLTLLGDAPLQKRLKAVADAIVAPQTSTYSDRLASFVNKVCGGDKQACELTE